MATVLSQETSTTVAPRTWIPSHPPPTGPVRILALDGAAGGALRGYAQIKIVRSLMQAIWRKNNPGRPLDEKAVNDMRPCDHFNMIFGSGTGGAIAVYLGRLNLTIKECEDHYKRLGEEVYARPCSAWNPFCRFNYDSERLEQVLKEQTKPFIPANANTLEFSHQRRINPDCKVAVLTKMVHNAQAVHLIKSYDVESAQVWEAIRATTATYYDFPNIKVGRLLLIAPDAGFSNPSGKAWNEATALYTQSGYMTNRGIWFISIGSGVEPENELHEPVANPLEVRIHRGLKTIRGFVRSSLSTGPAAAVMSALSHPASKVQTWVGYTWEFASGSLPGQAERLKVLARESHETHLDMRKRPRLSSMDAALAKLHYYRLDLKLPPECFEYGAWKTKEDVLKTTFSPKNTALLPEAPLMQSINFASAFFSNASPPVRVLTLDGSPSAISAVVQIKILRELMKAIWKKNPPPDARHSRPLERDINEMRPAEYFDLIVGSGIGGALAVYLGWFRFTMKECEDHFRRLGDHVYSVPFSRANIWQKHNYDHRPLVRLLQDQARSCDFYRPEHGDATGLDRKLQLKFCYQQSGDRGCKVAVLSSVYPEGSPRILRSYAEGGVDGAHEADVWQVMQATMATNGDFPPAQIGATPLLGPEAEWINPAVAAFNETQRLYGRQRDICIISMGSGLQPEKAPIPSDPLEDRVQRALIKVRTMAPNLWALARGRFPAKAHPLRDLAIGCEHENRKMLDRMRERDLRHYFDPSTSNYSRFNLDDFPIPNSPAWTTSNMARVEEWANEVYLSEDIDQNLLSRLEVAVKQL